MALAFATPALAGPSEDFHALMDQYWAAYLKNSPLTATSVGVSTYDSELDVLSLAEMDRQAAEAAAFLGRLEAIPAASLSSADQSNRAILKRALEAQVAGNKFGERQMLYSTLGSYHSNIGTMADNQPFRVQADYANYLERLAKVPARMRSYGEISAKAAREGFVQPCVTMAGFAETITGVHRRRPDQIDLLCTVRGGPAGTASPRRMGRAAGARARSLINGEVNPAYRDFAALYERDLKGKCRQSVGVSELAPGQGILRAGWSANTPPPT